MTDACPTCGRPDRSAGTRMWTPDELAARWDKPASRVRWLIRKGYLHSRPVGPFQYIPGGEVDRYENVALHAVPNTA